MKPNLAVAVTSGEPQYLPKDRHEYTNEDKKKANLDNVAKDILFKTLDKDKNMFNKIKSCTTAKDLKLSLKTELSRLKIENDLLRNEASELKAEVDKLTKEMSSWNKSTRSLFKLYESQKPLNDKPGVGFNYDSSHGETSTQSQPVYDKFNERSFVKGGVIHDCIESIRYDDQDTSQPDRKGKGKVGVGISCFRHSLYSTMASAFITYSYQINFEYVLMIHDHEGMLNMFKALEASGLRRFLGCESVLYEKELGHFFDTALIQGEDITGAISGKFVSISPTLFAKVFDLPTEGISNFSEVPKEKVYDARSFFSQKGVQIDVHGKKKYMKNEFRLLNDILAKALTINFEYVLMIHDHEGMLNMFKALEASGLRRFLGCESVLYEKELGHFFDTALIQGEDITGAISGKFVSISPTLFAKVFDLPTEGISNFSEVPKEKVYDARSFFSQKGSFDSVTVERFQMMTAIHYGLKVNWGKVLFNVLKDMVDRSQRKAKGFAAQIGVLLKGMSTITMGDGVPFPNAKILSMKTVHTYIVTNTTIDARAESEEPGMAKTPKAKKKTSSADEMIVDIFAEITASKKRSATEADAPIISKKRRTRKSKPSVYQRRLVLSGGSDDESVGTEEIVKDVDAAAVASTDEADIIIAKVLEETLELGVSATERESQGVDEALFEEDFARWLDDFVARHNEPEFVGPHIDTQAEGSIRSVAGKEVNISAVRKQVTEESMPTDDLLLQISNDLLLPITAVELTKIRLGEFLNFGDVQRGDLYSASLPRISSLDKGKGILVEDEQVRVNPAREIVELICTDVAFLVNLRDQIMVDVENFFHSFSINKLTNFDALLELKEKEKFMLEWAATDSLETDVKRKMYILAKYKAQLLRMIMESHRQFCIPGQHWTATASQIFDLLSDAHSKSMEDLLAQQQVDLVSSDVSTVYRSPPLSPGVDSLENDLRFALGPAIFSRVDQEERLYFVQSPESAPAISPHLASSSSSTDVSMNFDSTDVHVNAQTDTQSSASVDFTKLTEALEELRSSLAQRIHDSNCEMLSKLNAVELGVRGDLLKVQSLLRQSFETACRVLERQGNTQTAQITDLKKGLMAPVGTIFGDLFDIKKKQREQDARLTTMDEQIAAIRSEHLDFQSKIAADILSLSTQVGDIADFLRGGAAKKGEMGSSSRPSVTTQTQTFPPTTETFEERVAQARRHIIETGQVISIEEAAERVIETDIRESDRMERERERERRDRRQISSTRHRCFNGFDDVSHSRHHDITIIFSYDVPNRYDDVSSTKSCKWKDMMTSSVLQFANG
ncbi:hypothetical protein F511_20194 [Dorcoceras hygrometricum]|uniref:Dystroglycan-like n=1 Tax=Dorcoceras hygrometricum TaxID=472368 RepID=A0A2Z7A2G3_9LAMI|nr:hypothetical protein F511_20194 [Dorcoceras hygrometricum]